LSWKSTTTIGAASVQGVTKRALDIPTSPHFGRVLDELHSKGHRALIVGGAVRDALLGEEPKDIDVEVYGTNYEDLSKTLAKHGKVDMVGQAFGVAKFRDPDGNDYDFSLPRRENKSGVGHRDFTTEFDPDITPKEAAGRRDFTFNCFAGETRVVTRFGTYPIKELAGGIHELLTEEGEWVKSPVEAFGVGTLMKITLHRNRVQKTIYATPNHRWFIRNMHTREFTSQKTTETLTSGNRFPTVFAKAPSYDLDEESVCRGFVFGDGSISYGRPGSSVFSVAYFCGDKDQVMLPYFGRLSFGTSPKSYPVGSDSPIRTQINSLPPEWKEDLPDLTENVSHLHGWLAGYFAADGCVDKGGVPTLSSSVKENLEFVVVLCRQLGIGTYEVQQSTHRGSYSPGSKSYTLTFARSTLIPEFFLVSEHRRRFEVSRFAKERLSWVVGTVEPTDRIEEVYCAVVPNTHSFVIDGDILTSNSMGYDPVTKELHDYYGGEQDLKDRVIRHTSAAFSEDPLRVLRGMQLAARYGMGVHPDTAAESRRIAHEYPTIPKERVGEEFMKLATKGKEPGRAISYLQETGWSENFPELHDMYGIKQEPKWHPEESYP